MTFIITLLVFTLGLTGFFAYLIRKAVTKPPEAKSYFALSKLQPHFNLILVIHIILLTAFISISILVSLTPRPFYYFGMEAALFASGLLIALQRGRGAREYILIFTIIVVSLSNIATVTLGNGGIPVSTDEYRDVLIANSIASGSEFRDVQLLASKFSGYYALIPALPTSLQMLSTVTGLQPYLSFPILGGAVSFTFVLGTYLAVRRFIRDTLPAWIVAFIALSTPRLVSIYTIPEWVSMAIISAAFVMLFIRLNRRSLEKADIKYFAIMAFLLIASIIYHPNGPVTILVLLGSLFLATWFTLRPRLNYKIQLLCIVFLFISLIYWSYNDFALSTISNTNARLFHTFLAEYGKSSYTPPNLASDEDIFALPWATPVALSLALLIVFARKIDQRQLEIFGANRILICRVAAIVALPMTVVGFVSFLIAPSAAVERYISVTAYFLMLIPASLFAGPILRSLKAPYVAAVIVILSISVAVGSYSPEFAPNEHISFEAARPTLAAYLELAPVQNDFPLQSYVYADNDVPIVSYLKDPALTIQHPVSFQKGRGILGQLSTGELVMFDAIQGKVTIFVVKTDRMQADPSMYKNLDLVSSTGNHMTFVIERN